MKNLISIVKHHFHASSSVCLVCLTLVSLTFLLTGCFAKSIDDVINQIDQARQAIVQESTAWRDVLPKLVNDLQGLESQVNADTKGVVADATNQVQDLASQTIQLSDAKAQDLIAQAGVEFRCNAQFVKAGALAQLQYIIDDLKFWKQNKRHLDRKPEHAVCWINPSVLSLYPSGSNWSIDASNMSDANIVHVFGYNYRSDALPTLELQDGGGHKIRDVNLRAAYITHYQINLDFSNENFASAQSGARVVFRWPDQEDPNTINLTLHTPAKLKISNPVFTPSSPTAQRDSVMLKTRITNQGGLRSGSFNVVWKPDPGDSRLITVNHLPLNPGEYVDVSLSSYVYQRDGTINSVVSLSNGDDAQTYTVRVAPAPQEPLSKKFRIEVTTGSDCSLFNGPGTNANVFITLYGDRASSNEMQLDTPNHDDFECGKTDTFDIITSQNLGNLVKIHIRHDNTGLAPGWFLERVRITNQDTSQAWNFTAHRWLATDEDDHAISIYLTPS